MEAQQRPTAAKLQELAPPYPRQTRKHEQNSARKKHAIPHDIHLVEGDKPSEQARKACQKHTQVQLHESFPRLAHLLLNGKIVILSTVGAVYRKHLAEWLENGK